MTDTLVLRSFCREMRGATVTRLISASAVAGLLVLIAPAGAQACSCATYGSPRDDARAVLEGSDGAFIGVLRSVHVTSPEPEPGEVTGPDRAIFRYRVRRAFGVKLGAFVKLKSTTDGASCGLSTRRGREIALGIYRGRRSWISGLCSYMRPDALRAVAGDEDDRETHGACG